MQIKDGNLELCKSYFDIRAFFNSFIKKYAESKTISSKFYVSNTVYPVLYGDTQKVTYILDKLIKLILDHDLTEQLKFKLYDITKGSSEVQLYFELYKGKYNSPELLNILESISTSEVPTEVSSDLLIVWYFLKIMKGSVVYKSIDDDELSVGINCNVTHKQMNLNLIVNQYSELYSNKKIMLLDSPYIKHVSKLLKEIEGKGMVMDTTKQALKYINRNTPDLLIVDLDTYKISKDKLDLESIQIPVIGLSSKEKKVFNCKLIKKPITSVNLLNTLVDLTGSIPDKKKKASTVELKTELLKILIIGHMNVNQKVLIKKMKNLGCKNIELLTDVTKAKIAINKYNVIFVNITKVSPQVTQIINKIKKYKEENDKNISIIGVHGSMMMDNTQKRKLYRIGIDLILDAPVSTKNIKTSLKLVTNNL